MRIVFIDILLLFLLTFLVKLGFCQKIIKDDSSDFVQSIKINREQSYITILDGLGNIEPLIFEATIVPYYMLRLNGSKWAIDLSPKIVMRMFREESYPVRTPSYMPRISFYYNALKLGLKSPLFFFISWCHHSNGQDGYFYNKDSLTINTRSGSFSTNMFEIGSFAARPDNLKKYNLLLHKTSFEYHYHQDPELRDKYGNFRINTETRLIWYPHRPHEPHSSIAKYVSSIYTSLKLQWIVGNMINTSSLNWKRLTVLFKIAFHPTILNEIMLFIEYYHGQDYYNIYFGRTLNILRLGIATDLSNSS